MKLVNVLPDIVYSHYFLSFSGCFRLGSHNLQCTLTAFLVIMSAFLDIKFRHSIQIVCI